VKKNRTRKVIQISRFVEVMYNGKYCYNYCELLDCGECDQWGPLELNEKKWTGTNGVKK